VARILVVNGPNLDLLGKRQPEIYGRRTLKDLESDLTAEAVHLGHDVTFFQSNDESQLVEFVRIEAPASAGVIINAGALSHYSQALAEALKESGVRAIEVHISNVFARESFRHISVISPVCVGQVVGLGLDGYRLALRWFAGHISG